MLPVPVYFAILLACWAYSLWRGGGPEKVGASIIGIGSILSEALVSAAPIRFSGVEMGVFAVDVATLVACVALALVAERFWPLWVAALQLIGTAGHAVKLVDASIIRLAYAIILAFWTYPMLLLIVVGTHRHQVRLARAGGDKSWSTFFGHSEANLQRSGRIG
jgi:hypothetical protein